MYQKACFQGKKKENTYTPKRLQGVYGRPLRAALVYRFLSPKKTTANVSLLTSAMSTKQAELPSSHQRHRNLRICVRTQWETKLNLITCLAWPPLQILAVKKYLGGKSLEIVSCGLRPRNPEKSPKSLGNSLGSLRRVPGKCRKRLFGLFPTLFGHFSGFRGRRPRETLFGISGPRDLCKGRTSNSCSLCALRS